MSHFSTVGIARAVEDVIVGFENARFLRGIVTGTSGNLVLVRFAGHQAADSRGYARLDSYTPTVDDEVLCLRMGKTGIIVLGKILR